MKALSNFTDSARAVAFQPSDTVHAYVGTGSSVAVTIPTGAKYASFAATGNFYARFLNAVATSGYQTVTFSSPRVGATVTGLANDATAYTASVSIDGAANAVSVVGSAAQNYTDLITQINADLSGATAALNNGNIRITSASTGATSVIAITAGTLFPALTTYSAITTSVVGLAAFTAAVPSANVTDGTASALNPTVRDLSGLTSFALAAPAGVIVTVSFYGEV